MAPLIYGALTVLEVTRTADREANSTANTLCMVKTLEWDIIGSVFKLRQKGCFSDRSRVLVMGSSGLA